MGNGAPVKSVKKEKPLDEVSKRLLKKELSSRRAANRMSQNIVNGDVDRDVHEFYTVADGDKSVLGTGYSGAVRICIHNKTGIKYALKSLNKGDMTEAQIVQLRNEIEIMTELDHPNILRIQEFFETGEHIYIILELCNGGDLLSCINKQKDYHFSERRTCELVSMMLSALRFLHDRGIVHRDIKLDNFLLETKDPGSKIKMIDFGFSAHFKPREILHRDVGTPYYVAPEVLEKAYDCKCDIWSIGVVTYMLLTGQPPFPGNDDYEIFQNVRFAKIDYSSPYLRPYTIEVKEFIHGCLQRDVKKRFSAEQAQAHSWFTAIKSDEQVPFPEASIDNLMSFTHKNEFTKLCMEVVAHSLSPEQLGKLADEFALLDVDKKGVLTLEGLKAVMQKNSQISDEDVSKIFEDLDTEHRGTIHYHEFIAGAMNLKEVTDTNLKLAFEKISHHNDTITKEDITALLGCGSTPEKISDMFADAGVAEDQSINFEAFKRIMLRGNTGGHSKPKLNVPYKAFASSLVVHNVRRLSRHLSEKIITVSQRIAAAPSTVAEEKTVEGIAV